MFCQCLGLHVGEVLESLACSWNFIFKRFTVPEVDTVIPAHGGASSLMEEEQCPLRLAVRQDSEAELWHIIQCLYHVFQRQSDLS